MQRTILKFAWQRTILTILVFACLLSEAQIKFSTVKPVIKEHKIFSRILNEERKITIYKPPVLPNYINVVSPVIYILDGEYHADFIVTLINYVSERFVTMPPITVVGIENFGEGRAGRDRDMTALIAKDSSVYKTSGGAEKFLQFIREEVFPLVEKDNEKTPYRVLVGHSLAGFLTMHCFLQHPQMFNAYLASSPALNMDNSAYLKIAEEKINNATERKNRLFFNVAYENAPYLENAKRIDSLLQLKKLKGLSFQFQYYPKETHGTVYMKSFYDGLHYIFQMDPPGAGLKLSDITWSMFENHFKNMSEIFGYAMKPEESLINNYGYQFLLTERNIDKALEFFKKNVENYPQSANVYDSYAEALLAKGDKKNAIVNYEKAFQMDPTNTPARDIVNKLKAEQ
jgi:predicted alpha/beta superfamily hydrolase